MGFPYVAVGPDFRQAWPWCRRLIPLRGVVFQGDAGLRVKNQPGPRGTPFQAKGHPTGAPVGPDGDDACSLNPFAQPHHPCRRNQRVLGTLVRENQGLNGGVVRKEQKPGMIVGLEAQCPPPGSRGMNPLQASVRKLESKLLSERAKKKSLHGIRRVLTRVGMSCAGGAAAKSFA